MKVDEREMARAVTRLFEERGWSDKHHWVLVLLSKDRAREAYERASVTLTRPAVLANVDAITANALLSMAAMEDLAEHQEELGSDDDG